MLGGGDDDSESGHEDSESDGDDSNDNTQGLLTPQ